LEFALPTLPATSWKRKATTVVVPSGNRVVLSAFEPLARGASRTGERSRLSVAVPPARKVASTGEALPRAPAASVAATLMLAGGVTTGDVLSSRTVCDLMGSLLPALSSALKKTVVVPSAVIPTEPPAPLIVCVPAWAPKRVTTMSFTPEPPGLSVAASASVTSWLFQPEALAAGDGAAFGVGGVGS